MSGRGNGQLLLLVIAALFAVLILVAHHRTRRRRAHELEEAGAALGLTPAENPRRLLETLGLGKLWMIRFPALEYAVHGTFRGTEVIVCELWNRSPGYWSSIRTTAACFRIPDKGEARMDSFENDQRIWYVKLAGDWIVLYVSDLSLRADDLTPFLEEATEVFRRVIRLGP